MLKVEELKDWKDGINKVIMGDCFNLIKQMPNECVDSIVTDVPYNTGMSQKENSGSTWLSHFFDDNYTDEDYQKLVDDCAREFYRVLKNDKGIYVFINWKEYPRWFNALKGGGLRYKGLYSLGQGNPRIRWSV
jgi:site-specific DNA-methyltransferase (adenine-specific)